MGEEKDVGGGVDVDAVVQDDDGQKQNVDDGKSDETLKKIQINEMKFLSKTTGISNSNSIQFISE